jgi:hypothetical protein
MTAWAQASRSSSICGCVHLWAMRALDEYLTIQSRRGRAGWRSARATKSFTRRSLSPRGSKRNTSAVQTEQCVFVADCRVCAAILIVCEPAGRLAEGAASSSNLAHREHAGNMGLVRGASVDSAARQGG